jgi:hydroxymethylpyrimidine/phosphomethylpyrimidine kinase
VTPPVALTIAGSDSGGGAGIQADLRSFAALGVFGTSVITATTAQNTTAVTDVHVLPAEHVTAQLDAVLGDFAVAAVKTGMLATAELVELVGRRAAAGDLPLLVVDPVLVAASGAQLLADDAVATYREQLLPHAAVVTPNLIEAGVLVGAELDGLDDVVAAAEELVALGAQVAVVKGGHADGPYATDVVVTRDDGRFELEAARIASGNDHGTGCTFAASTAAGLAAGLPVRDALEQAKRYVTACIAGGADWDLGAGHGPLDHLGFGASALPPFSATGWTRAGR